MADACLHINIPHNSTPRLARFLLMRNGWPERNAVNSSFAEFAWAAPRLARAFAVEIAAFEPEGFEIEFTIFQVLQRNRPVVRTFHPIELVSEDERLR